MGFPSGIAHLFASLRPTVGRTYKVLPTSTAASKELPKSGFYRVQNMGPAIVYIRMDTAEYNVAGPYATTDDMPLFPYGSDDMSSCVIEIGPPDIKAPTTGSRYGDGHPLDPKHLHYICAAGENSELRITRITKD